MYMRLAMNRLLTFATAMLLLAMVAGHTSAFAHGDSLTVVILGSSTAAGANADPLSQSWVGKFTTYLDTTSPGSQVINLSVGGFTTFNVMPTGDIPAAPWNASAYLPAVNHNITAALALDPDLIIVNLPTNDCDLHVPVDRQMSNYAVIVGAAAARGVPVWISTTQPRTNGDAATRALLTAMVPATYEAFPDRTIDFWTGLADVNGRILTIYDSDQVHLNNAGHAVLYDRVVSTVAIHPPASLIVMHPRSRSVSEGDTVSFRVIGSGNDPLAYQWQRNGTDLEGETGPVLTFTEASPSDSGATFRCIVTKDAESAASNEAILTVTPASTNPSASIISDDFSSGAFNNTLWSVRDPLQDATISVSGIAASDRTLSIAVPGGTDHDIWAGINTVVRVLQEFPNRDFEIEARFASLPSEKYQMQGLIVQKDSANLVRFDVVHQGSAPHIFAATFIDGIPTVRKDSALTGDAPLYLRLKRAGNLWTGSFSYDGASWTTAAQWYYSTVTTAGGVFAGNTASQDHAAPAFTAMVDYFFNTSVRIQPEDAPPPPALISPASGATGLALSVDLSWNATGTGPDSLMVSCNPASWSTPIVSALVPAGSGSHTIDGLVRGATYFWRVRSSADGIWGRWSSAAQFSTVRPMIILRDTPLDSAALFTPDTTWACVPSNTLHDWKYDDSSEVPVLVNAAQAVTFSSCSLTVHWNPAKLTWRGVGIAGSLVEVATTRTVVVDSAAGSALLAAVFSDTVTLQPLTQPLARLRFGVHTPGRSSITMSDVLFSVPAAGCSLATVADADTFTATVLLGDVAAAAGITTRGDGRVDFNDLNVWSLSYWSDRPTVPAVSDAYRAKCDIGPTADGTPWSMPAADGRIDFEDLMIMAQMYGTTESTVLPKVVRNGSFAIGIAAGESWTSGDTTFVPILLRGTDAGLRGLALRFPGIAHKFAGLSNGALLGGVSPSPLVFARSSGEDLEVHIAASRGCAGGIRMNGELLTLRLLSAGPVVVELQEARDGSNTPIVTTGTEATAHENPTAYALGQNYPNPFNPSTRIPFTLVDRNWTRITVHNVLGQMVATLLDEVREPGTYTLTWEAAGLPSGVYLCHMASGSFAATRRMLLIR